MSVLDFTMLPGTGSFFLSESVSEYVPNGMPNDKPTDDTMKSSESFDPYVKMMNKLSSVWSENVVPLGKISYAHTTDEDAANTLSTIQGYTNTIFESLTHCVQKIAMLYAIYGEDRYRIVAQELRPIMGDIIRFRPQLIGSNMIKHTISTSTYSDIFKIYAMDPIFKYYKNNTLSMDKSISLSDVGSVDEYFAVPKYFPDYHTMFNTVFNDPDRMIKLSTVIGYSVTIDDLIHYTTNDSDNTITYVGEYSRFLKDAIPMLAEANSNIKHTIYDLECDIATAQLKPDVYADKMCRILNIAMNIFNIIGLCIISYTMDVSDNIARTNAIKEYISELKTYLISIRSGDN